MDHPEFFCIEPLPAGSISHDLVRNPLPDPGHFIYTDPDQIFSKAFLNQPLACRPGGRTGLHHKVCRGHPDWHWCIADTGRPAFQTLEATETCILFLFIGL